MDSFNQDKSWYDWVIIQSNDNYQGLQTITTDTR